MDEWLAQLALTLDVDPIDEGQQAELLEAARDVAHGVERKVTPLAAYLLGTAVGRRIGAGEDAQSAFTEALADLRVVLTTA
jgi:hypothetical protein